MIRGLFRFILQLITLVIVVAVLTAVWIVYDGINDQGDTADCAVVLGTAVKANGMPAPVLQARLDRAIQLYQAHKVPLIIVSGADHVGGNNEATAMATYLETQGVPASAVIQDHGGINTDGTAHDTAKIMRARNLHSVMVVTSYYHIARTKMALRREGVSNISQAHSGVVRKEDAFNIAREVIDIYYHLFKYYLAPATAQAAAEAQVEATKLKEQISSGVNKVEDQGHKPAAQP
jgi:vancomycin permeability regulator SanA